MKNTKLHRFLSNTMCAVMMFGILSVLRTVAFAETDGVWTYTVNSDGVSVTITNCATRSGDITVPATLGGKTVTGLGLADYDVSSTVDTALVSSSTYAFKDCTEIKSVTLPESLITIGYNAFEGCTMLNSITIPKGVTRIMNGAFENCAELREVTLSTGITAINDEAFECCSSLTSFVIPNGVTSIGNSAFYDCNDLSSVSIPEGVTEIGMGAFTNCFGLTSLKIPSSADRIGARAFDSCNFKSVRISSRNGYTFGGWYTAATGGALIESTQTIATSGFDFSDNTQSAYTHWTALDSVGGTSSGITTYSDVSENDWFCEAVYYVLDRGLMNGTGLLKFDPNTSTDRAMIVTVLWRLEGKPAAEKTCTFKDVKDDAYYLAAVAWAQENGIVKGYDANTFGVSDYITREQLAAILYRYAVYKNYGVTEAHSISAYTDAVEVSDWAQTPMKWANSMGLITGVTSKTLEPKGSATRAQCAAILMRFVEHVTGN